VDLLEDLVDVGRVGLLAGLGALLLVTRDGGGLLASLLLLSRGFAGRGLAGGGGGLLQWESENAQKMSREKRVCSRYLDAPEPAWVPFRVIWVV
jgi:hypothetical protein